MEMQEDVPVRFGLRLRALRLDAELSQEQLAVKAGLHFTYISQVERGKRNPTIVTLARIASALQVPLAVLVAFD